MAESNSQNRVIMRALPSPIESLPIELISKTIYFIAEDASVYVSGVGPYEDNTAGLAAAARISSSFRLPSERVLYKRIKISTSRQISSLSQLAPTDYRLSFIKSLYLQFTAENFRYGLSSKDVENLQEFVSHIPLLTTLHIESTMSTYREVISSIIIAQTKLEFLMLFVKPSRQEDGDGFPDLDNNEVEISIDGIDSLLNLKELVLMTQIKGQNYAKFFGNSVRPNLQKLTLSGVRSSSIYASLQYFPSLVSLSLTECDDLNLISSLPPNLKRLTVRTGTKLIEQFKNYQPVQLTHLSIDLSLNFTQDDFDNLSYLPNSIVELTLAVAFDNSSQKIGEELSKYRVGELKFKKLILINFCEYDPTLKEALWNKVVVESERLGLVVEERGE